MSEISENSVALDLLKESSEAIPQSSPVKIEKSALLKVHGETGWLIVRLQRYALLGWSLFFILFVVLIGSYFLNTFLPKPLLVVDSEGRVMGEIDFFDPVKRLDEELLAGGMKFLSFYLSVNSETIFDDYSIAMNMMTLELLEQAKVSVVEDGYLAQIEQAKSRSHIEFSEGENVPKIIQRGDEESSMRLQGTLTVFPAAGSPQITPFDITLFLKVVPSTTLRRSGIEISAIHDN